jgi:murein tripeptide amidase MpaA
VKIRFYIDPITKLPHIYGHNVSESEVEEIGRTHNGRYLRVIYVPDPEPNSVFVITAYDLSGKPLSAYRRRQRRKPR